MFRRSFGRPVRRLRTGRVHPALRQANRLMDTGQYAAAAELYEKIANGALAQNRLRSPWFFLQTGRARLLSGQVPAGMAHVRQGLSLLAANGQLQRFSGAGNRIVMELESRGLSAEAMEIKAYIQTILPAGTASGPSTVNGVKRSLLPTTCSGCGGPLRSDEVEWVDDVTAECPYCGSQVRAE
jgi:hypothetical protein